MPPLPGMFAVPYNATHKSTNQTRTEYQTDGYQSHHHGSSHHNAHAGSSRTHGVFLSVRFVSGVKLSFDVQKESDSRRDKKRREFAGRLGKEMNERRDEYAGLGVHGKIADLLHDSAQIHDRMKGLLSTAAQLSARPETSPLYTLRLYPLSLERSALLAQCSGEERRGLACVDVAYKEEKMRVEEECRNGRERVKDRLLEGLEERRKKAREEKEGEGTNAGKCHPIRDIIVY